MRKHGEVGFCRITARGRCRQLQTAHRIVIGVQALIRIHEFQELFCIVDIVAVTRNEALMVNAARRIRILSRRRYQLNIPVRYTRRFRRRRAVHVFYNFTKLCIRFIRTVCKFIGNRTKYGCFYKVDICRIAAHFHAQPRTVDTERRYAVKECALHIREVLRGRIFILIFVFIITARRLFHRQQLGDKFNNFVLTLVVVDLFRIHIQGCFACSKTVEGFNAFVLCEINVDKVGIIFVLGTECERIYFLACVLRRDIVTNLKQFVRRYGHIVNGITQRFPSVSVSNKTKCTACPRHSVIIVAIIEIFLILRVDLRANFRPNVVEAYVQLIVMRTAEIVALRHIYVTVEILFLCKDNIRLGFP